MNYIDRNDIVVSLFIVAMIQSFLGIFQYLDLLPFSYNKITGIRGTLFYSNVFGCLMTIGLCINLYLFFKTKNKFFKGILLVSLFLMGVSLMLSLSRTAYLAFFIGAAILLYFHNYHRFKAIRSKYIIISSLLFFILLSSLWAINLQSVIGRLLIWRISLNMFLEKPFFGIGYGNFFIQYGNYQADYFVSNQNNQNFINVAGMNYHPFNELIRIGVENGILGIFFVIVILCLTARTLIKSLSKYKDAYLWGTILIVILVFGTVSYPFTDLTITTIFVTCICVINSFEKACFRINFKPIYKYTILVCLFIILGLALRKMYGIQEWAKSKRLIDNNFNEGLDKYERVFPILSNNASFLFNYGAELAAVGDYQKSINVLLEAAKYGTSTELYTTLGNSYLQIKNYTLAEKSYIKAAFMEPKKIIPLYNLFHFYRITDQPNKAKLLSLKLCTKVIKIPSIVTSRIKREACSFYKTETN